MTNSLHTVYLLTSPKDFISSEGISTFCSRNTINLASLFAIKSVSISSREVIRSSAGNCAHTRVVQYCNNGLKIVMLDH